LTQLHRIAGEFEILLPSDVLHGVCGKQLAWFIAAESFGHERHRMNASVHLFVATRDIFRRASTLLSAETECLCSCIALLMPEAQANCYVSTPTTEYFRPYDR
jgi:hypothetical protein